jgi:hypothetical protein
VNDYGAYPDEMRFMHAMEEREVNRLLAGQTPSGGGPEMERVADFVRALGAAVPEEPDPAREAALVTRLSELAKAGAGAAAQRAAHAPTARRSTTGRLGLVLKLGGAAALLPAFLAALAFAGVSLPGPAQDAFDRLGIELPNQAGGDENSSGQAADEDSDASSEPGDQASAKGDNGRHLGLTNRRSHRRALGPSQSARQDPAGDAIRRGPNPTPGTARGKPDTIPSARGDVHRSERAKVIGQTDGRGKNG